MIYAHEYTLTLTPQVEFFGREKVTSRIRKQEVYGDKESLKREREREKERNKANPWIVNERY